MVVTCESCGRKYKIDLDKVKGERARFNCKGCGAPVTVDKNARIGDGRDDASDVALLTASPVVRQRADAALPNAGPLTTDSTQPTAASLPDSSAVKGRSCLTAKVFLLMLFVGIVPGAIYFALSSLQTSRRIETEIRDYGLQISELLAGEVDEWIDKNLRVLQAAAQLPELQQMSAENHEAVLKAVQAAYPWMYLVFTTDRRGINVARSDGETLKDYSSRQYVRDIVEESKAFAWQNLIGKTSKKPALVLAVPIRREPEGLLGVLAAAMTREIISELVTTWKHGEAGNMFLIDENNMVVAHQQDVFVTEQRDFSDNPLVRAADPQDARELEFVDEDGVEMIGFTQRTDLGWLMAIQQPKSEAFRDLTDSQRYAFVLLGGTVMVILLISVVSSRALVQPIRKLTEAANRISVGELNVEIVNHSPDEIGELADAIIRMQDSIRLSIVRLQRGRT